MKIFLIAFAISQVLFSISPSVAAETNKKVTIQNCKSQSQGGVSFFKVFKEDNDISALYSNEAGETIEFNCEYDIDTNGKPWALRCANDDLEKTKGQQWYHAAVFTQFGVIITFRHRDPETKSLNIDRVQKFEVKSCSGSIL